VNQPLPLKDQLIALEQLQELDLKIDSLTKNKNELPASIKAMDDSLGKAKHAYETRKAALGEIEKAQRQTQAAMDLNRDRMQRSSGKLEGVHNSQEFNAANKEIEQLKKQAASLEEQSKKYSQDLDAGNAELTQLQAKVDQLRSERDAKAAEVSGQGSNLDGQIQGLMQERSKFTPSVEKRILSQYDRIRQARGGLGIVPALGGRCKGCNMVLPPQQYNELQRGTALHQCPSCFRLLYIPAQSGQQSAVST